MIRRAFFSDSQNGYGAYPVQKNFNLVWRKIEEFEKNTGKCLDDGLTKDEYIQMFNSMGIRHASTFPQHKAVVRYYIRYLISNSILPADQERILASINHDDLRIQENGGKLVAYFKDLEALKKAITNTVEAADSYDKTLYDLPAAILYLAWYGLTEDEIISLPKEAVVDSGIMVGAMKFEMADFVCELLKRLRDAEGYYQQARGVIFHQYVYSDFLIRTEKKHQIDLGGMRGLISRFNRITNRKYSLSYDVVRQSGVFYRAFREELVRPDFNLDDPIFASYIFHEDMSKRSKHLAWSRDYNLYNLNFAPHFSLKTGFQTI